MNKKSGKESFKSLSEWRKSLLEPALKKHPNRKESFQTSSGIEIPDLSAPTVETTESYLSKLGFPGAFPFTRGVQPTMFRGRFWTMRQYAGFGSAKETNKRYKYLLKSGASGLSAAFDLPTQMGRDSDSSFAKGEVGRVGVAIDSLADMEVLFDKIPLEKISVSMTINSTAHILLGLYLALAKKRKIPWEKLRGTVQNDVLKEYVARGTYIYPPTAALRITTDIFDFCAKEVPNWNTISISGYHIREAGSNAVQEIAFTLADGIAYVEAAIDRGMKVDEFAPRLAFFFNCHNNFIEEVAKFRAARRLWAKIMKERFHAKDERSMMLRFHTQTAGSSLIAQQPLTNVVRTTLQAMSAIIGGTQSLHTNAYDEALCLPTEKSALLALRTQQIIASESGIADFVDALGGSYAVEELTDQLEAGAIKYIQEIDDLGGMVKAIEAYFPQKEIEESAFRYQKKIETKESEVVGVNVFTEGDELQEKFDSKSLKIDPTIEKKQISALKKLKKSRKQQKVDAHLKAIHNAAKGDQNLMPLIVSAVSDYVTLGEISDALRDAFGSHHAS